LSAASRLKYAYLAYFSKPKPDRKIYRFIRRRQATRIVELGMGTAVRARRMISVAMRYSGTARVGYAGIDAFETRAPALPQLTLKTAYRQLCTPGVAVRLLPGELYPVLAAMANSLLHTDLLLIEAGWLDEPSHPAWFFVPRMIHERTLVLRQQRLESGEWRWQALARDDIFAWAAVHGRARRAA